MVAVLLSTIYIVFILVVSSAADGASKEEEEHHLSSGGTYENNVNEEDGERKSSRINILNLDEIINPQRSGIVGLGIQHNGDIPRLNYDELHANDMIEDSFYDPFSPG
jgi:hypothetical protein